MNKEQARELAETCRKYGIRLIPLFNCLGHQSARGGPSALLKKHPRVRRDAGNPAGRARTSTAASGARRTRT